MHNTDDNELDEATAMLIGAINKMANTNELAKGYADVVADMHVCAKHWSNVAKRDLADLDQRIAEVERQRFILRLNGYLASKGGRADWTPECGEPQDARLERFEPRKIH
jgi:hypothetical protein